MAAEQFRGEVSWPVARVPGIIPDKGRPDARDLQAIMQFSTGIYDALKRRAEKSPAAPFAVPFAFLQSVLLPGPDKQGSIPALYHGHEEGGPVPVHTLRPVREILRQQGHLP